MVAVVIATTTAWRMIFPPPTERNFGEFRLTNQPLLADYGWHRIVVVMPW